jgi:hypothetical protein
MEGSSGDEGSEGEGSTKVRASTREREQEHSGDEGSLHGFSDNEEGAYTEQEKAQAALELEALHKDQADHAPRPGYAKHPGSGIFYDTSKYEVRTSKGTRQLSKLWNFLVVVKHRKLPTEVRCEVRCLVCKDTSPHLIIALGKKLHVKRAKRHFKQLHRKFFFDEIAEPPAGMCVFQSLLSYQILQASSACTVRISNVGSAPT